jgi:hypothetical protein
MKGALYWIIMYIILYQIIVEHRSLRALLFNPKLIFFVILALLLFPLLFTSSENIRAHGLGSATDSGDIFSIYSNLADQLRYLIYRIVSRLSLLERNYLVYTSDNVAFGNLWVLMTTILWDIVPRSLEFGQFAGMIYNRFLGITFFDIDPTVRASFGVGITGLFFSVFGYGGSVIVMCIVVLTLLLSILKSIKSDSSLAQIHKMYIAFAIVQFIISGNVLDITQALKELILVNLLLSTLTLICKKSP